MSGVAIAVIIGFICCALVIRTQAAADGRARRAWDNADRSPVTSGMPRRAMMDE